MLLLLDVLNVHHLIRSRWNIAHGGRATTTRVSNHRFVIFVDDSFFEAGLLAIV